MTKVYIGVVAYNHRTALSRCVQSLAQLTYDSLCVEIWDNSEDSWLYQGSDNLARAFRDSCDHELVWTRSSNNLLWTPALNKMVAKAMDLGYDYFMTLNHDVQLPARCVIDTMEAFEDLPDDAGVVGPVGHGMGGQQDITAKRPGMRERVNFVIGACAVYKREVFEKVGLFDENMPLSGDDFDYAIRMKEAGYSLWVNEGCAPINHISHVTKDSPNWGGPAQASWDAFNVKYNDYYANETEAIQGLWNGPYNPDYPIGTGISREEKIRRGIIR